MSTLVWRTLGNVSVFKKDGRSSSFKFLWITNSSKRKKDSRLNLFKFLRIANSSKWNWIYLKRWFSQTYRVPVNCIESFLEWMVFWKHTIIAWLWKLYKRQNQITPSVGDIVNKKDDHEVHDAFMTSSLVKMVQLEE